VGLKIRDAGGTLRTIVGLKIRDAGGTLRTIADLKVRDAGGTLRTVFTSGGGGGTSVWIDPPSSDTASTTETYHAEDFTVGYSGGVAPTSYAWGVVSSSGGSASVLSGATTATARLRLSDSDGGGATAEFYCDVTISGVVYRAFCSMAHTYYPGGFIP
jgi:hypothetical protein